MYYTAQFTNVLSLPVKNLFREFSETYPHRAFFIHNYSKLTTKNRKINILKSVFVVFFNISIKVFFWKALLLKKNWLSNRFKCLYIDPVKLSFSYYIDIILIKSQTNKTFLLIWSRWHISNDIIIYMDLEWQGKNCR